MEEKIFDGEFKRVGEPFLWGALCWFIAPTTKRYFKENPKIKNPDVDDYDKSYWKNSSRSAISFGMGILTGVLVMSEIFVSGLEQAVKENDPSQLLISGGILAGTNLLSAAYEIKRKYF